MDSIVIKMKKRLRNTNENNKVIINNVMGTFIIKGLALLLSLFTMPAYIRYFNNQQVLGLWFTMLSVLSWILTFDLGIGNGLRNHLVHAFVNKDKNEAKKYISSAYICVGTVALVGITIAITIFKFINWNIIFNVSESLVNKNVLNTTVLIVFSGIMIQFLLKLVTSILYAMQKSALINLLSLLNSIIILGYVVTAKSSDIATNLISLAVIHVLAVNLPLLITTVLVFNKNLRGCTPNIKFFEIKYAKEVMKLGGLFFWVQIMYMIFSTTNEFLITWLVDPNMVVEYQIYNKLFTLIGTFFTLALTPIWSSVTKAVAEQNYLWIKKLFGVLKVLTICAIFVEFLMIPFLQLGINLWLGKNSIQVNYLFAVVFAISGSMFIWNGVISSIANGFGRLKVQTICFTIGAVIKIPLAFILVNILNSWIGIILANIISMTMYCIIEPIKLNQYIEKMRLRGSYNV